MRPAKVPGLLYALDKRVPTVSLTSADTFTGTCFLNRASCNNKTGSLLTAPEQANPFVHVESMPRLIYKILDKKKSFFLFFYYLPLIEEQGKRKYIPSEVPFLDLQDLVLSRTYPHTRQCNLKKKNTSVDQSEVQTMISSIILLPHKFRIGPTFNASDTLALEDTVLNLPSPSSVTSTTLRLVPPKSRAKKRPCSLPIYITMRSVP